MHTLEKCEISQTYSGQKHEKVVSKEQACSFLCFPQDQVVLGMLRLFNSIWAREGVMHTLPGGGQVAVHAPLYRCMTCSISSGFVEMLPRSTPVEDIPVAKTRADNGWRCSNDLIPTAVAGFISTWVLDLRDRHQGNMVLTETGSGPAPVSFANIDFGWVEEGPPLDTGALATTPVSCFGAMFYRKESTAGIHQDQLGTKIGGNLLLLLRTKQGAFGFLKACVISSNHRNSRLSFSTCPGTPCVYFTSTGSKSESVGARC